MTTADDGPGVALPGARHRLSLDVRKVLNKADRYEFDAIPVHGAGRTWSAHGDIAATEQGLAITRLIIEPAPHVAGGVTGALLREIPLGALLDHVRGLISAANEPEVSEIVASAGDVSQRGGRQALSDDLLREVAVLYLAETAPGKPSGAVKRMAERYGRPTETIRTWLARSRQAGWLGPSEKGKAGAKPGPRLLEARANGDD